MASIFIDNLGDPLVKYHPDCKIDIGEILNPEYGWTRETRFKHNVSVLNVFLLLQNCSQLPSMQLLSPRGFQQSTVVKRSYLTLLD